MHPGRRVSARTTQDEFAVGEAGSVRFDRPSGRRLFAAKLSPRYRPMVIFAAAGFRPAEWRRPIRPSDEFLDEHIR